MPQSFSELWTHVIFSTKNRYPFLEEQTVRDRLYRYIRAICRELQCEIDSIGGIADHIHILVNLHKNMSIATLVEKIKISSSKWIKTMNERNDDFLSKFYWQKGYAAFGISYSNISAVRKYIQNQAVHHRTQGFQDELRQYLSLHSIEYNEKYLWD